MGRINLEFDKLEIDRAKERWKLYFIIVAEHPEDNDKMVLTTIPQNNIIRMTSAQDNIISFKPEGKNTDGLFVLSREMPSDKRIKVRVFLHHSRKSTRNIGEIFGDIKDALGSKNLGEVSDVLGVTSAPWLVISKATFGELGSILGKIRDRDFGMVSMDEAFEDDFEHEEELTRSNNFSTGQAKIYWNWSFDKN